MVKKEYNDLSKEEKMRYDFLRAVCGSQFGSHYIRLITARSPDARNKAFGELGELVKQHRKEHPCRVKARDAA